MKKYVIFVYVKCLDDSFSSETGYTIYENKFYNTKEECQKRCDELNKNKPNSAWLAYSEFKVEELTEYTDGNR